MPNMPMTWEVAELVRQRTERSANPLNLYATWTVSDRLIDEDSSRGYFCALYGPYFPVPPGSATPDRDTRIFVCYRMLDGRATMQLLCQDTDDDAFLNHNAYGVEQYDLGVIHV